MQLILHKQKWFFPNPENCTKLEAIIVSVAKLAIYRSKQKNSSPSVQYFMNLLKLEAEKDIGFAKRRNSVVSFSEKWGLLGQMMTLTQRNPLADSGSPVRPRGVSIDHPNQNQSHEERVGIG